MKKYLQIHDYVIRAGRPETDQQIKNLASADVKVILNLQSGFFEFVHGITNRETMMCLRNGIAPVRMELSDIRPPAKEELDACLDLIKVCIDSKQIILFHCMSGVDRTGMLCAYFRVKYEGWDVERAIQEWKDMGMHYHYYPFWIPAFRNYVKQ